MRINLRLFLLLLIIISSNAVHADPDIAAHTNDASDKHNALQAHDATNMILVLNEHLYEVQQNNSTISFRVDSPAGEVWASFQDFKGRFTMFNNGVHNDPAMVNINTESLATDSSFIGMLLKGEGFFDVENFPSMSFVGSSFEWFNDAQAVLKGDLTIQNVTRPVAFYVELINANADNKYSDRITVKATTTIKRSAFGIYTLLPVVSDNVNLYLSIDALKKDTLASI